MRLEEIKRGDWFAFVDGTPELSDVFYRPRYPDIEYQAFDPERDKMVSFDASSISPSHQVVLLNIGRWSFKIDH